MISDHHNPQNHIKLFVTFWPSFVTFWLSFVTFCPGLVSNWPVAKWARAFLAPLLNCQSGAIKIGYGMSSVVNNLVNSLLLLEFSTDFHKTWHKCSTSQEKKLSGTECWILPSVKSYGVWTQKLALSFENHYFYSFQPIFTKSVTNVQLVKGKNVQSRIWNFGLYQKLWGLK